MPEKSTLARSVNEFVRVVHRLHAVCALTALNFSRGKSRSSKRAKSQTPNGFAVRTDWYRRFRRILGSNLTKYFYVHI